MYCALCDLFYPLFIPIQLRSVEETTQAMAFDGIILEVLLCGINHVLTKLSCCFIYSATPIVSYMY